MSAEVRNQLCRSHPIGFDLCDLDMDLDISRWVLEFLVRKVIDDRSIKQVLLSLPLLPENCERLRKTMLLRAIGSEILDASVSEKVLDLLEKVVEVDRGQGHVVSESLKSAYCAVAVDCTVRFMEDSGNAVGRYFVAVKRIWRGRIGNLEKSDSVHLISDQLWSWRDELEAAVLDDEVSKKIITRNTRNEALKAIRVYVNEAWKVMGPTFLEVTAKKMGASLMEAQKCGEHGGSSNQVEEAITQPDFGGDLGVTNESAKIDKCQVVMRASSKSNTRNELSTSKRPSMKDKDQYGIRASRAHPDLVGGAKPAITDEIHVQSIAIPLPNADGDSDIQAKRNKDQSQERASTTFDASLDLSIGDRPTQHKDGVTTFPRHLGGSTEPAISDGERVEDIAITLPNSSVKLGVSDELTKRDKDQVAAATSSSAIQDLSDRERSIMKHRDECGEEVAATYCQDNGGSAKSAMPIKNQAEEMAMLLVNARGKLMVSDKISVRDKDHYEESAVMTPSGPALRDKELENANVLALHKHAAGHGKRSRRGIKIADVEESSIETTSNKFDCLPSPEVNKVQEALRSSTLELQAVVKDPLTEALSLANSVLSDMGRKYMNHNPVVETEDRMDVDVPDCSFYESVEIVQASESDVPDLSSRHQNNDPRPILIEETQNRMDANALNSSVNKSSGTTQGNEDNPGNQFSSHQNKEGRPSLMARNGTAVTYEWEDSIDGSPEGPSQSKRLHLQSPKRRAVSPLKKYEPAKVARKRKLWSSEEEETLRIGVQKFGRGYWKLILNSYRDIFKERTEVDLKDKWRNLMK